MFVNPVTASIGWDVLGVALACIVFMLAEARRLRIRWVWAYVIGGAAVAISVTFPLFLIARERRLAVLAREAAKPAKARRSSRCSDLP